MRRSSPSRRVRRHWTADEELLGAFRNHECRFAPSNLRAAAVESVVAAAGCRGWGCQAVTTSPLPGPSGNVEYFVWLRNGKARVGTTDIEAEVRRTAHLGAPGEKVEP